MHQQCQNVIFCCKRNHIIAKSSRINFFFFSCKQLQNDILYPKFIGLNIDFQSLIGFCLCPVVAKFSTQHGFYNRLWIVNRNAIHTISIIPFLCFREWHVVLFAKLPNFLFCKACKLFNRGGIRHGILIKDIDSRVFPIFFDRQNASHIGKGNVAFVL